MEEAQLDNEQNADLTPEEIEALEGGPGHPGQAGGEQTPGESAPKVQQPDATQSPPERDAPVVLNKSGKGIIPYEKHKELRVENSALREQLKTAQAENGKTAEKLQSLLKQKESATGMDAATADKALVQHLETLKKDMPELHHVIHAVVEGSRKQGETLGKAIEELKREQEEQDRASKSSAAEQVAEAKENNPDLVHWESQDPDAWDEALRQDEILRASSRWAAKPYAERFAEVARRVRAIMPEASMPQTQPDLEKTKADAKARLSNAPERKLTTLSDIQGGANPASEREQLENLSPFELTQRLMKMSAQQGSALRADLD